MNNIIKVEATDKANIMIKKNLVDKFYVKYCFTKNKLKCELMCDSFETKIFNTEEEANIHINSTLLVNKNMNGFNAIARSFYFDKENRKNRLCYIIKSSLVNDLYGIGTYGVIVGGDLTGIYLWVFKDINVEQFINDFQNKKAPNFGVIDILIYKYDDIILTNSYNVEDLLDKNNCFTEKSINLTDLIESNDIHYPLEN